jgi:hypothetical protein
MVLDSGYSHSIWLRCTRVFGGVFAEHYKTRLSRKTQHADLIRALHQELAHNYSILRSVVESEYATRERLCLGLRNAIGDLHFNAYEATRAIPGLLPSIKGAFFLDWFLRLHEAFATS